MRAVRKFLHALSASILLILITMVVPAQLLPHARAAGLTWSVRSVSATQGWQAIASSADGTKLAAMVANGGNIYTSTDSGASWTDQTAAGSRFWTSIT